jgi:hypothetical protein
MLVPATGVAVNKAAEPVTRGGAEFVPIMVLISASKAARLGDERDSSVWADIRSSARQAGAIVSWAKDEAFPPSLSGPPQ